MKQYIKGGLFATLLAASGPASAGTYSYTVINTPQTPYWAYAQGLNDNDEVVGLYVDANVVTHAFFWSQGATTIVDYPGASYTELDLINDSGLAVGLAKDSTGSYPFTYDTTTGTFAKLNLHGSPSNAYASGINASGTIVGVDGAINMAFQTTSNGATTYFLPTKALYFSGPEISDAGTIIIASSSSKKAKKPICTIYAAGQKPTSFPLPAGDIGYAVPNSHLMNTTCSISGAGNIFGNSFIGKSSEDYAGFVFSNGTATTLQYMNAGTILSGETVAGVFTGTKYFDGEAAFIYTSGTFEFVSIPGASAVSIGPMNTLGSFAGSAEIYPTHFAYIAQCPQGQQPCTP